MKMLRRYLSIYGIILRINLQKFFAYRLNAIVRSLYSPVYFLAQYFTAVVVYQHTPSLGGWSRPEGILLMLVATGMFCFAFMLFWAGGLIDFTWNLVRNGKLDQYLTKPISLQFLIFFSKPSYDMLLSCIVIVAMAIHHVVHSSLPITPLSTLLFFVLAITNFVIIYLALSTYSTVSFYVTRAEQIEQILNKASDFAQFPINIFPKSLQVVAFTLLLFAYMGYLQTATLFGKGELWHWLVSGAALIVFGSINRIAWKHGLRQYTSASS